MRPSGFEAFLTLTATGGRDQLPWQLRGGFNDALRSLESDASLANREVTDLGQGSYSLEHGGVLLVYEFENALVVRVFAVFAIFGR